MAKRQLLPQRINEAWSGRGYDINPGTAGWSACPDSNLTRSE
jgi:hypothetical protein